MRLSELLEKNDNEVNKMVSQQLRIILIFIFLIWLLNMKGIFIIETYTFNKVMLLAAVFLLFPTVLVDIAGVNRWFIKYIIILCVASFVFVCYAYLTYHIILMFVYPVAVASLYFNSRPAFFSVGISLAAMVASHLLSIRFRILTNDPFQSFYEVFVYGLLPRSIEFIVFSIIIISLAKRTSKLLNSSLSYGEYMKKSKDGLDIILNNTSSLFKASNEKEVASVIFSAFKCLISIYKTITSEYTSYFGMVQADGSFFVIKDTMNMWEIERTDDLLRVDVQDAVLYLNYFSSISDHVMYIEEGYLIMPFYRKHNLMAFCFIQNDFKTWTDARLKQALEVLYGNVLLAVSNMKLTKDMYQTQEELVRAFAEVCESKSKQTGQHIKRVSEYMKVMADALDLQDNEKNNLVIASMMHDIGKLLIPSEIIEKNGKLTLEEFEQVKAHVHYGFELLKYSPGRVMEIAKVIALQHHEKWNGKGYLGIKGENIDYYSRIMAVVDVFDALISKRSYKDKWSIEDAYNEIVSQSGEHFDPAIVRLFCDNFSRIEEIVKKYPD